MAFQDVPIRENGDDITEAWSNTLRVEGIALETKVNTWLGGGGIVEAQLALANNQAATNITGLVLDKTLYKSALVFFQARRKTDAGEAVFVGRMALMYRDFTNAWDLAVDGLGDELGVTFSITGAGQVQYATDNMAGAGYSGKIVFKAVSFNI